MLIVSECSGCDAVGAGKIAARIFWPSPVCTLAISSLGRSQCFLGWLTVLAAVPVWSPAPVAQVTATRTWTLVASVAGGAGRNFAVFLQGDLRAAKPACNL